MAENSKIGWCHHTHNFWLGCTELSPACAHCYAKAWSKRAGRPHLWLGERQRTSAVYRRQPHKWNRAAAAAGQRHRVFGGSLSDFFDNQVPCRWRDDAWHTVDQTRNLDWMFLTKRPENIPKMLPSEAVGTPEWGEGWPNVWLGTTVEDRARTRRIDTLRAVPAVIRFLSIEPLLEDLGELDLTGIHLVIVGGESGPHARPLHPNWVRSVQRQCAAAGVAFFFKQWGEWCPRGPESRGYAIVAGAPTIRLTDAGGNGSDLAAGGDHHVWMNRVGRHRAGRRLDGVEHNGMPQARV